LSFSPAWSQTEESIEWPLLRREWLSTDPALARTADSSPLYGNAEVALITATRKRPRSVDVYLELAYPPLVRQPEYLVLIDGLVTATLGRPLLDETLSVQRAVAESRITPLHLPPLAHSALAESGHPRQVDLSPFSVLLAALLLFGDLLLARRTARG
jgi:hypothetical protein